MLWHTHFPFPTRIRWRADWALPQRQSIALPSLRSASESSSVGHSVHPGRSSLPEVVLAGAGCRNVAALCLTVASVSDCGTGPAALLLLPLLLWSIVVCCSSRGGEWIEGRAAPRRPNKARPPLPAWAADGYQMADRHPGEERAFPSFHYLFYFRFFLQCRFSEE